MSAKVRRAHGKPLAILARIGLCLLISLLVRPPGAAAHPLRVSGTVLTLLARRDAVVVRCDAVGTKPSLTTLYELAPQVRIASLHPGDRIVGLVDDDAPKPVLDGVRVVGHSGSAIAPSAIRLVHPYAVGDRLPATRFTDQRGGSFTFADFHGSSLVLAFIYTRCRDPKECPAISSSFHALQKRFGNGPYHLVEMTLDPSYDRPGVLARYGNVFGADPKRWTLATGDPDTVLNFDARFGIDPFADPRLGLIHTERTVLVRPDGTILDFIDQAGWNPADVAARLDARRGPSNMFERWDFELSKAATAVCGNGVAGFSGLEDLAIVIVIIGSGAWLLQRLARKIFAAPS